MLHRGFLRGLRRAALPIALLLAAATAAAAPNPLAAHALAEEPTTRLLVLLRPVTGGAEPVALASARVTRAAELAGVAHAGSRPISAQVHVLHLAHLQSGRDLADTLDALRAQPGVAEVQPDRKKFALAIPNDTDFPNQWFWQSTQVAAVNMESAWDLTTGSTGTVIAVLDTGVRFDHPDLGRASANGRLLAGYDFVGPDPDGGFRTANDGDGWDADPSDPGDWISKTDTTLSTFQKCSTANSSWHGTRTSGLIGALTNNGLGIAGGTWKPWLLPVRVLGKCGGYDSDIQAAMRWAAGLSVAGVPDNKYPAKIENLSLGGTGACDSFYQSAVNDVIAQGTVIVVSAGNDGTAVASPANCQGVVAVAGLRHVGTKVGYSDLGPEITLGAPAGNCGDGYVAGGSCVYSIDTTTNLGTTTPGTNAYTDQVNYNLGTSFSAPIVSAIAGLMHSVNGNLTPAQFVARLQEGAAPYPTVSADATGAQPPMCLDPAVAGAAQNSECICTTAVCGAGMANAPGALKAAARPIAAVAVPTLVSSGSTVTLNAAGSAAACGHTIASYAWSVTAGSAALSATAGATTSLTAPTSGTVTVRLVVTDEAGKSDTADVTVSATGAATSAPSAAGHAACPASINPNPPPPSTPSSTGQTGGGGGGGALSWIEFGLLGALAVGRRARAGGGVRPTAPR